jgi:hypothetical protein
MRLYTTTITTTNTSTTATNITTTTGFMFCPKILTYSVSYLKD